jgi:hypothetical protein
MNEEQRFAFDTWGFLTVENALTPEQVTALKATVDEHEADLYSQLKVNGGFWSQEFFDLLDVPVVSSLLDEIYGGTPPDGLPAFRIDHINVHTHGVFNKDLAGGGIHGGNGRLLHPEQPHELLSIYSDRDPDTGVFRNGLVSVAYELEDTVCNGGGFGCLPGSHKSHAPVPEAWRELSKGVHPMVTSIPAPAGTAIIFTEALSHVTLPWTAPSTRTTLFYKYTPRDETYCAEEKFFHPSDADGWAGANDRKRTILKPPSQEFIERRTELGQQRAATQGA